MPSSNISNLPRDFSDDELSLCFWATVSLVGSIDCSEMGLVVWEEEATMFCLVLDLTRTRFVLSLGIEVLFKLELPVCRLPKADREIGSVDKFLSAVSPLLGGLILR